MIFAIDHQIHDRQLDNVPTVNKVAAVFVVEFNKVSTHRHIAIHPRGKDLHCDRRMASGLRKKLIDHGIEQEYQCSNLTVIDRLFVKPSVATFLIALSWKCCNLVQKMKWFSLYLCVTFILRLCT